VGHRLLLVMNLVIHKRKSNLARQNKSPRIASELIYRKKFTGTDPVKIGSKNALINSPIVTGDDNTITLNPAKAQRTLTIEQKDRLEALVKSISPQEIAFRHNQGDGEAQKLVSCI
jgi:hypothetical protein